MTLQWLSGVQTTRSGDLPSNLERSASRMAGFRGCNAAAVVVVVVAAAAAAAVGVAPTYWIRVIFYSIFTWEGVMERRSE